MAGQIFKMKKNKQKYADRAWLQDASTLCVTYKGKPIEFKMTEKSKDKMFVKHGSKWMIVTKNEVLVSIL